MSLAAVALSAALGGVGAVLRWLLLEGLGSRRSWLAILFVNIAGSAIAGGVTAFPDAAGALPLIAGLCGGLTTFSTLALHLVPGTLTRKVSELLGLALAHSVGGVGACLAAYTLVSTLLG